MATVRMRWPFSLIAPADCCEPLHTSYRRNRTTSILPAWASLSAVKARPQKYDPSLVISAKWNNAAMASLVTTRSKFTILFRISRGAEEGSCLPFTAHVRLITSLGGALEAGFGQIDITLDTTQGLVVDGLFIAQPEDGVAFGLQRFSRQFLKVLRKQALDAFFMRNFTAQLSDAVVVFGTKAFHRFVPGPMGRFDRFEPS